MHWQENRALFFVYRSVRDRLDFDIDLFALHAWTRYFTAVHTKVYIVPEDREVHDGVFIYLHEVERKLSTTPALFEFLHPLTMKRATGATALVVAYKEAAVVSCLSEGLLTIEDIITAASEENESQKEMSNACINIHKKSLSDHLHSCFPPCPCFPPRPCFPHGVLEIIWQYITWMQGTLNVCVLKSAGNKAMKSEFVG
jgi:hypothetical protein